MISVIEHAFRGEKLTPTPTAPHRQRHTLVYRVTTKIKTCAFS
uniref:Uncharacterized protein n=1 Tax=Anguilla anguilla TaxID=7936 RepID=A0A0E9WPC6_ANGAN